MRPPVPQGPAQPGWGLPTGVPAVPRVHAAHHPDPGAQPAVRDAAEGQGPGQGVRHLGDHGVPAQRRGDHHLRRRRGECRGCGWSVLVRSPQAFRFPRPTTVTAADVASGPDDLVQVRLWHFQL